MKIFAVGKPKKASLNLSINAIVIVILAMTLMGLGLTFTRTIFARLTTGATGAFDKLDEELQTKLATGDENFIFSSRSIEIGRGDSKLEGFVLKNSEEGERAFGIEFVPIACPKDSGGLDICDTTQSEPVDVTEWFLYKKGDGSYAIPAADVVTRRIDIDIPRDTIPGKYLLEIIVTQGTGDNILTYETTDLFVIVG